MEKREDVERVLQITADGSHTIFIPAMNEHYHSVNGAIQESMHIFIDAGLRQVDKKEIRILEIGFGTGLNALLTLKELVENGKGQHAVYHTVELYPLDMPIVERLNYGDIVWPEEKEQFYKIHQAKWNIEEKITPCFSIHKIEGDSNSCCLPESVDLIYFDAFAPDKQPEMWNQNIFDKLYSIAADDCIIVTYCAKGVVRRSMQTAGFKMERLPGPPGKRHILRGRK